jgi:enoyl-CoA hydratase/carnithine racemase
MNTFNEQMRDEMVAAFDLAETDDAVRAIVVTGAGRAYCAGADLDDGGSAFKRTLAPGQTAYRDRAGVVTMRIFECAKPVIAAINGAAVGVGMSMTLPMDVRVMSDSAKFGFPFAARGIAPDGAASWFLPRLVGISRALEWCLNARVRPAADALEAGLVKSLHPADEVLGAALKIAGEIATSAAPVSAALTRQLLWRMLGTAHPIDAHRLESQAIFELGNRADSAEGVSAFLEKRPAKWTMTVPTNLPDWYPWWEEETF